ncbi:ShlB/FhaC/HecB family hemolysin secretion/activation protein [Herbaspirillum sp. alder98]|uniref:ShlB/FhaC/HecB family hemolysin secretion/activation protein n=1 Tax=Herbaspirillum sp. alder98 TaxID=2913096 RepID=UPI001CD82693|nr:ShlB/FhaC/HecB family hemolysin secretion/activation protein [Herbaspirillum sp. alder98]MCA1325586.1 ShlB/FhaC/HecB family hemolysin secretion/activation protein [Herbaspirillum sp. alder98]
MPNANEIAAINIRGRRPRLGTMCLALALCWHVSASAQQQGAAAGNEARQVDINEYIVRGNTVLDARAIEQAVTPFLGPKRTLKDVEGARDALLAAYNAKGYQSVYVDLPEQQVSDGIVFLQVTETTVGRVRVVGAQYNSPAEIRNQVPALKEGAVPDFTRAQAELTALNRGGKRQVMPLVKQGTIPGTMDVDLKVDDSTPWRGSVGLNNDYSADTSHLRATASIGYDNLWQLGHSISLSFYGTPQDFSQTRVWSGSYSAPLRGTNWSLEASGYYSNSNVSTVGGTSVLGKGHSVGLKAVYTVPTSGEWYHTLAAGVDFKDNQEGLRLGGTGDNVPLRYAPITLGYTGFRQGERSQFSLNLSMVSGTRSFFGYGSNESQFDYKRYKSSPSFTVFKGDLNGSYTLASNEQIGYRLSAQMTDAALISTEQIAAGGSSSVRGYLSAEATGDYGLVGSLELRSRPLTWLNPWVENWRVYGFTDAGTLRLRDPLPEQVYSFNLASVGIGTNFLLAQRVSGRFDLAYPLKKVARTPAHDWRLNFSLTASY